MNKQPTRHKKAFKYLFYENGEFYMVLKVENELFISDYKTSCCDNDYYNKWIKSVEDRIGYKIKIYGDKRYNYTLTQNDKLYKVVRAGIKLNDIQEDFK